MVALSFVLGFCCCMLGFCLVLVCFVGWLFVILVFCSDSGLFVVFICGFVLVCFLRLRCVLW